MDDSMILKAGDFLQNDSALLAFMLGNIRNEMKNQAARILSKYDITLRQCLVIAYLTRHPDEVVTQKTLETHMSLSNPTVTVLIQNMARKGLVTREKVPGDGRKNRLRLTPKASRCRDAYHDELIDMEVRFFDGITDEEKEILMRIFQKMERNLGISSTM